MVRTICNSCFYARVTHHKESQSLICAYEPGAKIHRQYCPDYMNREGVIRGEKNKRIKPERYKRTGYSSMSI